MHPINNPFAYNHWRHRFIISIDFITDLYTEKMFISDEIKAFCKQGLIEMTSEGLTKADISSGFIKVKITMKGMWAYHLVKNDIRVGNWWSEPLIR